MEIRPELLHAATVALRDCLRMRPEESLLILTDPACNLIGQALLAAGRDLGARSFYLEMPLMERNGQEPPAPVAELMKGFDVVMAPTGKSLTHTGARRAACAAGARVATLPGIQEATMIRCLGADYYAIADRTNKVTDLLTRGNRVHIVTEAGTDLSFSVKGIDAIASTGLVHEKGGFGNLPSGEAYLRPLEGTAEGTLVVDGSMAGIGNLMASGETIRIEISGGYAGTISGGPSADRLRDMLGAVGREAFTVAEFGVGTNDAAQIIGNILEDEKVMGTIHIAFGNNMSMGGKVDVPIHLDGIVRNPTVEVDGKLIMERGTLFIG